jgi:hypothetical protein
VRKFAEQLQKVPCLQHQDRYEVSPHGREKACHNYMRFMDAVEPHLGQDSLVARVLSLVFSVEIGVQKAQPRSLQVQVSKGLSLALNQRLVTVPTAQESFCDYLDSASSS